MRFKTTLLAIFCFYTLTFFSCKKDNDTDSNVPKLLVKIEVNPNQVRLGNDGTPASLPIGHAGQNPVFNSLSAHYLELASNAQTPLGSGAILYEAKETNEGGTTAIDFGESKIVASGELFLELPLSSIQMGSYEWARLSLSYQNYDVTFHYQGNPFVGTIASFVGYNSYIERYQIKEEEVTVNANKLQGYWGFETLNGVQTGQSPQGATTVPNPLFSTSPIPSGSCVVTGQFDAPLKITGNETEDIEVTLSLSINKSFEWIDSNGNGKWDVTNTSIEPVVDMGLRGLIPIVE